VRAERGGLRGKQPLETRRPGPKNIIREVRREGRGCRSPIVLVQLTESAVVVGVDDQFSWC